MTPIGRPLAIVLHNFSVGSIATGPGTRGRVQVVVDDGLTVVDDDIVELVHARQVGDGDSSLAQGHKLAGAHGHRRLAWVAE